MIDHERRPHIVYVDTFLRFGGVVSAPPETIAVSAYSTNDGYPGITPMSTRREHTVAVNRPNERAASVVFPEGLAIHPL